MQNTSTYVDDVDLFRQVLPRIPATAATITVIGV